MPDFIEQALFERLAKQERAARELIRRAARAPHRFAAKAKAFLDGARIFGLVGPTACAMHEYLERARANGDEVIEPPSLDRPRGVETPMALIDDKSNWPAQYWGLTRKQLFMTDAPLAAPPLKLDRRDERFGLPEFQTPKSFVVWALERAVKLRPRGLCIDDAATEAAIAAGDFDREVVYLSDRLLACLALLIFPKDLASQFEGQAGLIQKLKANVSARTLIDEYRQSIADRRTTYGLPSIRVDPPSGWSKPGEPFRWKDWFDSEDYKDARTRLVRRLTHPPGDDDPPPGAVGPTRTCSPATAWEASLPVLLTSPTGTGSLRSPQVGVASASRDADTSCHGSAAARTRRSRQR